MKFCTVQVQSNLDHMNDVSLKRAQSKQHVGQHFDQHQLTNMLVQFALGTIMLTKEKMKEKCCPTFLKKLRNVGQQILSLIHI